MNCIPTYRQIATNWNLWQVYADPKAIFNREDFDEMSVEEKIGLMEIVWGKEQTSADDLQTIQLIASDLIAHAKSRGVVLTIELKPRQPLAMGNYEMLAQVRPARIMSTTEKENQQ